MKRPDVYKVIDGELFYATNQWGELDSINNVADFMLYMQRYLNKAKDFNNPGSPNQSLEELRKVVGLGIACFEKFGVPERA